MVSVHRTVQRLSQAIRDGSGASSIVERFDIISALMWIDHERRSEGGRSSATTVRQRAKRLSGHGRSLWPLRTERIPLDDATLEHCMHILESLGRDGAREDLSGRVFEELLRNTFEKGDNQQFFTPRPVVDFMVGLVGDGLRGRICDPACGTGGFLIGALDGQSRGQSVLVGWEVDPRLARASSLNLHLHGAAHHTVTALRAAGSLGRVVEPELGSFDVVITNPPFGSDLTDRRALGRLRLGRGKKRRRRGVLFVERCLDLIKPGGTVCIVIDESVTAGRSNADVRELICNRAHVRAVVSLPESSFMPYASVRTSILLLEKFTGEPGHACPTFFARAARVGRRSNGDPLLRSNPVTGVMELDNDLPAILDGYGRHGEVGTHRRTTPEWFVGKGPNISDPECVDAGFRLDIAYHHPTRDRASRELASAGHDVKQLRELVDVRNVTVDPLRDIEEPGFTYVGLADIEPHTGQFAPRMMAVGSVRGPLVRFEPGDILFARLRPRLQKVCFVGDEIVGGLASSECLVLVPRRDDDGCHLLDPLLMAALLRTDFVAGQFMHLITGIGRPRLSKSALLDIRLPVPSMQRQRVAREHWLDSRRREAELITAGHEALAEAEATASQAASELIEDLVARQGSAR